MTSTESTRILKANSLRGLGSKVVFNYEDLRKRCDEYVEQTRQQTEQMLRDAEIEAESIRRRAYNEALDAGRREGLTEADVEIERRAAERAEQLTGEKLKTILPAMTKAAETLARERDTWLAEWETAATKLCVAIAEKIIRRELSVSPEISVELLAETLQLAAGSAHISLRLHPDDAALLTGHAEEIIRSMASCATADLVPDKTISRGGCLVETQHGVIDARLETQLERIMTELLPPGSLGD